MSEWAVYEQAYGPIDGSWTSARLAEIHEMLQNLQYIAFAKAEVTDASRPQPCVRPGFMFDPIEDDEPDGQPEGMSQAAIDAYFDSAKES